MVVLEVRLADEAQGPSDVLAVPAAPAPDGTAPTAHRPADRPDEVHVSLPAWRGGIHGEMGALRAAYRACLRAAADVGAATLDVEALGIGDAWAYPVHPAAHVAVSTLRDEATALRTMRRIRILCHNETTATVFRDALSANALVRRPPP